MSQTKTILGGSSARALAGAKQLRITPWTKTSNVWAPGSTTYVVEDIVGDTISITQDDNETNTVESEFSSTPLVNNVTLGSIQFAATCTDLADTVLTALFGWTKDASSGSGVYAPDSYNEQFATVEVRFESNSFILPKVQMNSKVTLESLKTGSAQCDLAGTAYKASVKVNSETSNHDTVACIVPSDYTSLTIESVDIYVA